MAKFAARDLIIQIASPDVTLTTSAAADDIIDTSSPHGFAVNDTVVFTALTGGAGLVVGKRYFVISANLAAQTFQVSLTQGGAAVNFTTDATAGSVAGFKTLSQATVVGEAGSTRDLIDASSYGDAYKDYVTGQQDGEEISIEVALDPADTSHAQLKAGYDAGTKKYFVMSHAGSAFLIGFPAMITSYARGGERDGLLRATATLKILNPGVTDTP